MAASIDMSKLKPGDWLIGFGFVLVAFIVLFVAVGVLNLPVQQFVVSGSAGALGVVAWFAYLNRKKT
ncbi:MAG: hypothetical protein JWR75_313 [Devosia sp.]|nr:hypothetical protein [Devosia sp.]